MIRSIIIALVLSMVTFGQIINKVTMSNYIGDFNTLVYSDYPHDSSPPVNNGMSGSQDFEINIDSHCTECNPFCMVFAFWVRMDGLTPTIDPNNLIQSTEGGKAKGTASNRPSPFYQYICFSVIVDCPCGDQEYYESQPVKVL